VHELASLSTEFANNVSDATLDFKMVLTQPNEVVGIPPTALALAADRANKARRSLLDRKFAFDCVASG
jgi:oligopeptidase A